MERQIKIICSEYGAYVVNKLSEKYGFSAEEAIRELEMPTIKVAEPARRKDVTEKKPKAAKVVDAPVPSIPLPFCGKAVDSWCSAVVKNNKLYTQCTNNPVANGTMCKKCSKILEKEGSLPFGFISNRIESGVSFKDPKGKTPVLYSVIMAKLKITREEAETEAVKFGLTIPEEQFTVVEKARGRPKKEAAEKSSEDDEAAPAEKKARGRPKKVKDVKTVSKAGGEFDGGDFVASLAREAKEKKKNVSNDESDVEEEEVAASNSTSDAESEEPVEAAATAVAVAVAPMPEKPKASVKKTKQTEEEKAAAKEAAKAAKEAEKAAAKAAKEAEKAAAKAAKEAAKESEKAAAKAVKEAAKESEKAAAAKAVKEAAKEAENEANKTANKGQDTTKEDASKAAACVHLPPSAAAVAKGGVAESKGEEVSSESEEEEEEEEEEPVTVKKFEHAGKKYKISTKDNILYGWDDDEPVGVWNPKTNKIDELPSDDEDEEDEEDDD